MLATSWKITSSVAPKIDLPLRASWTQWTLPNFCEADKSRDLLCCCLLQPSTCSRIRLLELLLSNYGVATFLMADNGHVLYRLVLSNMKLNSIDLLKLPALRPARDPSRKKLLQTALYTFCTDSCKPQQVRVSRYYTSSRLFFFLKTMLPEPSTWTARRST